MTDRPNGIPNQIAAAESRRLIDASRGLSHILGELEEQSIFIGVDTLMAPRAELRRIRDAIDRERAWRKENPGQRFTLCDLCGERKVCTDIPAHIAEGSSYLGDSADLAAAEYRGPRFECESCEWAEMAEAQGRGLSAADLP